MKSPGRTFTSAIPDGCEPNHVGRSGSPWALGESFTYLDLSPFQVMEGLRYTLPRTMAARVPRLRRLTKLAHWVRRRPGIAAYLDSPRRLPIQHRGSLPALPRARGTHPRDPDGPRAPREPSPSWRIGSHASRPARRGEEGKRLEAAARTVEKEPATASVESSAETEHFVHGATAAVTRSSTPSTVLHLGNPRDVLGVMRGLALAPSSVRNRSASSRGWGNLEPRGV